MSDAPATPPAAQPATQPGRTLRTSDPAVLRALAHPLRVELLTRLDDAQEATASELAESTGQTVANASFHLRQLEKAGFIERAPERGREKPWRPVHRHRELKADPDDAASVRESRLISAAYVQHEADRLTRFFAREIPPAWVDTVALDTMAFWATADELRALNERVHHLVDAFAERGADPSLRPEGAVHARLFAAVNPELDHHDDAAVRASR